MIDKLQPETTRDLLCPHPSVFIREEMIARKWNMDMLAMRMGPEFGINRLSLDMYFEVGPDEPNMLMGRKSAEALGRAFGVSPDYFLNLHEKWRMGKVSAV